MRTGARSQKARTESRTKKSVVDDDGHGTTATEDAVAPKGSIQPIDIEDDSATKDTGVIDQTTELKLRELHVASVPKPSAKRSVRLVVRLFFVI